MHHTPRPRTLSSLATLAASALLGPAAALAAIQEPPPAGVNLTVGVNTTFIAADGLPDGVPMRAEVWRQGVRVAVSFAAAPAAPTGLVEFNHDPGPCFQGLTPALLPGDQIRVVDHAQPGNGYATTVRNLTTGVPTEAAPGVVTMTGTAATALGAPLVATDLEALIRQGAFRLLAPGDGVIAYDAPGGVTWTATFDNLDGPTVAQALAADRIELAWSPGGAAATETQLAEAGGVPTPSLNCTGSVGIGPGAPDLPTADDTGSSSTDNITSQASPTFTGLASPAAPLADPNVELVRLSVGGPEVMGTATVDAEGAYAITPTSPLANGPHSLVVRQLMLGEVRSSGALAVTVDTLAPATTLSSVTPASGANNNTPRLQGTADAGSTVSLFAQADCAGPAVTTGSAALFALFGLSASVADNSTTTFSARSVDAAGNVSPCSAPLTYDEVTPAPPADPTPVPVAGGQTTTPGAGGGSASSPTILVGGIAGVRPVVAVGPRARLLRDGSLRFTLWCRGLETPCRGRMRATMQLPQHGSPRRPARVVTIAVRSFSIGAGRRVTIVLRPGTAVRRALGAVRKGALSARIELIPPTSGTGAIRPRVAVVPVERP